MTEEWNDWNPYGDYRHMPDTTCKEKKEEEEKEKKRKQKSSAEQDFEPKFKILGDVDLRYEDVVGQKNVVEESKKYNTLLKNKELCTLFGTTFPNLLLHGEVGTGKTLLVQVMARENKDEQKLLYASVNLQDFSSKYINTSANQLSLTLEHLVKMMESSEVPSTHCVVFIDEFDSIGRKRGMENHREDDKVVNTLNTHMDGDRYKDCLSFIAATNHYNLIDLAQKSRFGIHLMFEAFKTNEDKENLFKVHLARSSRKMAPEIRGEVLKNVDCKSLAQRLKGPINGRNIRDIVNRVINNKIYEIAQDMTLSLTPEIPTENFYKVIDTYDNERKREKKIGY